MNPTSKRWLICVLLLVLLLGLVHTHAGDEIPAPVSQRTNVATPLQAPPMKVTRPGGKTISRERTAVNVKRTPAPDVGVAVARPKDPDWIKGFGWLPLPPLIQ